CLAGASALAREEARRGGASASQAVHHARRATAVADEIAWLFHEKGARVFHIMDDNLLPLGPADARSFLGELERELPLRRVGRIAFSLQLRADVATPDVVEALVHLGL